MFIPFGKLNALSLTRLFSLFGGFRRRASTGVVATAVRSDDDVPEVPKSVRGREPQTVTPSAGPLVTFVVFLGIFLGGAVATLFLAS